MVINPFEAEGTTISYQLQDTLSSLKVAVVSTNCSKDKQQNISKIIEFIETIMLENPKIELISFGETITGWYAENPNYISEIAEQIPCKTTDTLSYYAKKYGIYISIGIAEKDNNLFYNSMIVINPEGKIIGKHRKNSLTSDDINSGYTSEQNAQVIEIKDFKVGLMICADVNGNWLTNKYIDENIELIVTAFASPIGVPAFNLISRRMNAWQIFPNRNGYEDSFYYSGLIYVSDPAGNITTYDINKESYITYTIVK